MDCRPRDAVIAETTELHVAFTRSVRDTAKGLSCPMDVVERKTFGALEKPCAIASHCGVVRSQMIGKHNGRSEPRGGPDPRRSWACKGF
jgi:hypothetical protein